MHTILFVCDKDLIEYVAGLGKGRVYAQTMRLEYLRDATNEQPETPDKIKMKMNHEIRVSDSSKSVCQR